MGGNRPAGPPPQGQRDGLRGDAGVLKLDSFPPIPEITLEQRIDIGNILTKEQEDIFKLHRTARESMEPDRPSPDASEADREKAQKKREEMDAKINQRIEKSNRKVQKILSPEQYRVFIEKRNDFRFKRTPPARGDGKFPERRPEGMGPGSRRPN
jgi:Spy/CpxP family protein refolding chaperone